MKWGLWACCFLVLLVSGCTKTVITESKEDVYRAKAHELLSSLHQFASDIRIDENNPIPDMKNAYSMAVELKEQFAKLEPPTKLKTEHQRLVNMYEEFANFNRDMLLYVEKKDTNYRVKATSERNKFMDIWNDSPLTEDIRNESKK